MTHEQAEDMVRDLIQAVEDCERHGGRSNQENLVEKRQAVVEALIKGPRKVMLF